MTIEDLLEGIRCPVYPSDTFGPWLNIERRSDEDGIITMINRGGGLVPQKLLLPHQFYLRDLLNLINSDMDIDEVVGVPISSKNYCTMWKR